MSATAQITRLLRVSDIFRTVWPQHTAKHAAAASGLSLRSAQAWVAERCTPSAATLLLMAHRNDQLRAALMRELAEADQHEADVQMVLPLDGDEADPTRHEARREGHQMARPRGSEVSR